MTKAKKKTVKAKTKVKAKKKMPNMKSVVSKRFKKYQR